jgi:hypothetical protein
MAAGLTGAEVAAVRDGEPPALADPRERAVLVATGLLLTEHNLDPASYREVADVLGPADLFELTALVGYYSLLAMQLRVFDADETADQNGAGQGSS